MSRHGLLCCCSNEPPWYDGSTFFLCFLSGNGDYLLTLCVAACRVRLAAVYHQKTLRYEQVRQGFAPGDSVAGQEE